MHLAPRLVSAESLAIRSIKIDDSDSASLDKKMILSIHLRKCAGTTLRTAFQDYYGDKLLLDYGDEVGSSWPSSGLKRRRKRQLAMQNAEKIAQDFQIIHGHFLPDKYDHLPGQKRYITFMRDPVQRVASNYFYLKRNPARKNPDGLIVNTLGFSIEEFARHADNQNYQCRSLQTRDLSEYGFVGISEKYQESLAALNGFLGIELPHGERQNVNADAASDYDLSKRQREIIQSCNRDDMRLYDLALNRSAAW